MAKAKKRATAKVATMLRMREELRNRLDREAKKNDRSMNTEMVARLEGSFVNADDTRRDSQILKMLVGFSSENDQMTQMVIHLIREMNGLGEAEMQEMVDRIGVLFSTIKKKTAITTTTAESLNDA
jgi:hypothetical protein